MNERARELFERGYERQREGRLDEAIALYRASIEAEPSAEAHTFLGWAYSHQNRYDEAIAECRKAIATDPDFGNPYNDIGAYLLELGKADEAIPWLEKALEAPRYDPRHFPHVNLARAYAARFEYDLAVKHLEKALEIEPGYPPAARQLSKLLARMN
ncbi:MAG TPA: tetratricopeptide repeat protein [Planctomycetota bacterium]|nr:tetratricopeptide repeat protein [Planctomycetota bacterium]